MQNYTKKTMPPKTKLNWLWWYMMLLSYWVFWLKNWRFKLVYILDKESYGALRFLLHFSKSFEKIVYEQINSYMDPTFSHLLCGFRKSHNTQYFLLQMLEKWKLVLDRECNLAAIFMDISKAFDTLNHKLLLATLMPMVWECYCLY